ncbi:hypothetical protein DTA24_18810 [Klebsiella sp. P1CD1]|nr:hypothetical protein DTA24_18810 [Klebsiella sp. P1CD1]
MSLTEAPLPPALLNATSGKWLGSQQKGRPGSAQAVDATDYQTHGPLAGRPSGVFQHPLNFGFCDKTLKLQ